MVIHTLKGCLHARVVHVFHGVARILRQFLEHFEVRGVRHEALGTLVRAQFAENLGGILAERVAAAT